MSSGASDRRQWFPAVAWAVLAYGVHEVGNQTGLYLQFGWYQNLTHAASASALAGLVAVAGLTLGYRWGRLVAVVVAVTAAGALTWELVEYLGLLDPYGVALHFHDFNDALVDMAANAVGVSVTLGILWTNAWFRARGSTSETGDAVSSETSG